MFWKRAWHILAVVPAVVSVWLFFGAAFFKFHALDRVAEMCSAEKEINCFDEWADIKKKVDFLWNERELRHD